VGDETRNLVSHSLGRKDGNITDNSLVGVEVQGQARVVLLDDRSGGLLDGLISDTLNTIETQRIPLQTHSLTHLVHHLSTHKHTHTHTLRTHIITLTMINYYLFNCTKLKSKSSSNQQTNTHQHTHSLTHSLGTTLSLTHTPLLPHSPLLTFNLTRPAPSKPELGLNIRAMSTFHYSILKSPPLKSKSPVDGCCTVAEFHRIPQGGSHTINLFPP
jgi:hypothetical protein